MVAPYDIDHYGTIKRPIFTQAKKPLRWNEKIYITHISLGWIGVIDGGGAFEDGDRDVVLLQEGQQLILSGEDLVVVGQDHVGIVFPFRFEVGRCGVGNSRGSDAGDRLDLGFLENRIPINRLVVARVVVGEGRAPEGFLD